MGRKIHRDQAVIEKLTHEIAPLKRFKFAKRTEQLNPQQASLLDDRYRYRYRYRYRCDRG